MNGPRSLTLSFIQSDFGLLWSDVTVPWPFLFEIRSLYSLLYIYRSPQFKDYKILETLGFSGLEILERALDMLERLRTLKETLDILYWLDFKVFKFLNTVGLFLIVGTLYILISKLTWDLQDKQENKGYSLTVMCLCVNLTTDRFAG